MTVHFQIFQMEEVRNVEMPHQARRMGFIEYRLGIQALNLVFIEFVARGWCMAGRKTVQ